MRLTLDPPAPKRYGMQPRRRAADPIDLARATPLCWQGPIRPGASQEALAGGPKNAYGFDFPDGVDETYPVHVNGDVYTDTKVNSKAIVLAAHAAGEIEVTVIRPGDVGGPGSVWVRSPIAEMRKATGFPLPNGGNVIFSPVYIDNFVDGMVLAVSSGDAVGQVFNISDGQGVRCGDFFGQLATMSGGKLRTIPMSVAAPAAEVLGSVLRRLGQKTDLSAGAMWRLNRPATYSIERAQKMLGYQPRVSFDEGMAHVEDWLRSEGPI
jgi:nucleoside-diphosphate-sugar epimerase